MPSNNTLSLPESRVFILKIGGSTISPEPAIADVTYINKLKELILKFPQHKFVLTVGGGAICRVYQKALNDNGFEDEMTRHYIGMAACNYNAELVRLVMGETAFHKVYLGEGEMDLSRQVLITGVWVPGTSSNFDAVEVAVKLGSTHLVNISNIDYVYDKDPKQFPDAIKVEKMSWQAYRTQFNMDRHLPGQNIPFDVLAADLADKHNVKVYFTSNQNFDNLEKIIKGEDFEGTVLG